MFVLAVVGIVLLASGIGQLVAFTQRAAPERHALVHAVRATALFAAWTTSGLLLLSPLLARPGSDAEHSGSNGSLLIAACFCAAGLARVTRHVLLRLADAPEGMVRDMVRQALRSRGARVASVLRSTWKTIAPTGWHEVRFNVGLVDRFFSIGNLARGYLFVLVITPVLAALLMVGLLSRTTGAERRFFTAVLGYNALAVVSTLTTAVIVVILLVAAMVKIRVLIVPLDLRAALGGIALWTGHGTAAGVVTAALLPVTSQLVTSDDLAAGSALTPSILVEFPAVGAVLGYVLGLVVATTAVAGRAQNLLLRRVMPPSLLMATLGWLVHVRLGPEAVFESLTRHVGPTETTTCDDTVRGDLDAGQLVRLAQTCSEGSIRLDDHVFLVNAGALVLMIVVVRFSRDLRAARRPRVPSERAGTHGAARR